MVATFQDFASYAHKLLDNGYSPLPIRPGTKIPIPRRWSEFGRRPPSERMLESWSTSYPGAGIGIATGKIIGIDLDVLCPETAFRLRSIVHLTVGAGMDAPFRIGQSPKLLIPLRAPASIRSRHYRDDEGNGIDILASGAQFVAYGTHPGTKKPYEWFGESLVDVSLSSLPVVDEEKIDALLGLAAAIVPGLRRTTSGKVGTGGRDTEIVYDNDGRVVDGRDVAIRNWLYEAALGASRRGVYLSPDALAEEVWERCQNRMDLSRPKGSGQRVWTYEDVRRKAQYTVTRINTGHLRLDAPAKARTARRKKGGTWTFERKQRARSLLQADRDMRPSDVKVHSALLEDLNRDGHDYAAASNSRLMNKTGLSKRTVVLSLRRLERAGYWEQLEKNAAPAAAWIYKSRIRVPGRRLQAEILATR